MAAWLFGLVLAVAVSAPFRALGHCGVRGVGHSPFEERACSSACVEAAGCLAHDDGAFDGVRPEFGYCARVRVGCALKCGRPWPEPLPLLSEGVNAKGGV